MVRSQYTGLGAGRYKERDWHHRKQWFLVPVLDHREPFCILGAIDPIPAPYSFPGPFMYSVNIPIDSYCQFDGIHFMRDDKI